jgi:hypothetical protein
MPEPNRRHGDALAPYVSDLVGTVRRWGNRGGRGAAVIGNGETAGWWSSLPADRVTRLRGASERELAESANPLPADAPAIVFFTVDESASHRSADLVEMVVTSLETAAVGSTALWLPEFEHNAGTSTLERRAARTSAVRLAADSAHFGPYIAALAESASSGRPIRRAVFTVETRAAGSARALAAAHGRDVVALVLVVPDAVDADFVSTAAEWLCAHARAGVWLTGGGSSRMDRFPSVSVRAPEVPAGVSTVLDRFRPLSYPPIAGHPHPASDPEKRLYKALDQHEWATGREHNRSIRLGELSRPFTVDDCGAPRESSWKSTATSTVPPNASPRTACATTSCRHTGTWCCGSPTLR